jgi:hypothetical protein
MAILLGCAGLRVEITVADRPLPEHEDEDGRCEVPGAVSKYIEVELGAEFAIKIHTTDPFPQKQDLGYTIFIDGNLIESSHLPRAELKGHVGEVISTSISKIGSEWSRSALCFQKLVLGDATPWIWNLIQTC